MLKFHQYNNTVFFIAVITLVIIAFSSCSPTRRLAEDEELFTNSKVVIDKKKTDVSDLKKYQRITPNKKILGVRFHLFLYNLANPSKESFPNGWLREIGEPPVIYDSVLVQNTNNNFIKFLGDKGFNDANVVYKTKVRRQKARTRYIVDLREPTTINSIEYSFEDTSIVKYVFADTVNSLIKRDENFNKFLLKEERQRIENNLKNWGYYAFSREYVYYEVYPVESKKEVNVKVIIRENLAGAFDPVLKVRPHRQYRINNVKISPSRIAQDKLLMIDTVEYQKHFVTYLGKKSIVPSTLVNANSVLPGSMFSQEKVNRTYTDYSSLGLFRYINVSFEEVESYTNEGLINCNIDLDMRKRQSYAFEFNITNSGGDLGGRGGVTYNNYNLFRGGEHLKVGVSGGLESLNNRYRTGEEEIDPMQELGFISRLETPKFLLPFKAERFQRRYKPRTELLFSYNYQSQPKYNRTIANTSYGYNWKGNIFNRHTIHPLDFYLVKVPFLDSAFFVDNYEGTRLENSFTNHTILGGRYSYEFSNQQLKRGISFVYLKFNFETAGFMLNQLNRITNWGSDSLFFGVQYFQYVKADIDFRNYNIISPRNKIVYRIFAGVGLPYGNSNSMPFEKMYWSGGPYSIRAWGERTLGPGSYSGEESYNQLGDIKLEANVEYRFKLFWKAEGALFADAGNVWLLEETEKFPDSGFKINQFYKDIAIGVGVGVRLDLSFVILRTDFGFKLRDPSLGATAVDPDSDGASKWTFRNPDANFGATTFQFGIGYPF